MPIDNAVAHQARVSRFSSALLSPWNISRNEQKIPEMSRVHNTPVHRAIGVDAPVYQALTIPIGASDQEEPTSPDLASGIRAAMKRHPVATTFVATTAALAAIGLVVRPGPNHSGSLVPRLNNISEPQSLNVAAAMSAFHSEADVSAKIIRVCERVIGELDRIIDSRVTTTSALQSMKSDAEAIHRWAASMARNPAVTRLDLERAVRCLGVRLGQDKIVKMIYGLRTERAGLRGELGGLSRDRHLRLDAARKREASIDRMIPVLETIKMHLTAATKTLNLRLLAMAGR